MVYYGDFIETGLDYVKPYCLRGGRHYRIGNHREAIRDFEIALRLMDGIVSTNRQNNIEQLLKSAKESL